MDHAHSVMDARDDVAVPFDFDDLVGGQAPAGTVVDDVPGGFRFGLVLCLDAAGEGSEAENGNTGDDLLHGWFRLCGCFHA